MLLCCLTRKTHDCAFGNSRVLDLPGEVMFPDEISLTNDETLAAERPSSCGNIRSRVELSFEELFERYNPMVFRLAFRMLLDREEALDVTQEVFLTIFRRLDRFRGESSLKTWIYRIAINKASNRCRWWSRLRRRGTVSLDEHLIRNSGQRSDANKILASGESSPEEALLRQEERAKIEQSLLMLPVSRRMAVIMRDIEGLSYEEIADATHVSLGTVKSRIARGREELKRHLNGRLG